jgi:hypothetical protein
VIVVGVGRGVGWVILREEKELRMKVEENRNGHYNW